MTNILSFNRKNILAIASAIIVISASSWYAVTQYFNDQQERIVVEGDRRSAANQEWRRVGKDVSKFQAYIDQFPESYYAQEARQAIEAFEARRRHLESISPEQRSWGNNGAITVSDSKAEVPVYVTQFEISFDQWDSCVVDGACKHIPFDEGWGRTDRPVINVSYRQIEDQFLPWFRRITGMHYRLPTEQEWVWLHQVSQSPFSLAEDVAAPSNLAIQATPKGHSKTLPTLELPINAIGLAGLDGSVSEWTESCEDREENKYLAAYPCFFRAIRGGSGGGGRYNKIDHRTTSPEHTMASDVGFRLIYSPDEL